MRVIIDMEGAQALGHLPGTDRYTISLTQAMLRIAGPATEIKLVLNANLPEGIWRIRRALHGLIDPRKIIIYDTPSEGQKSCWSSLAASVIKEAFIASLNPDIVLQTKEFDSRWSSLSASINGFKPPYKTVELLYGTPAPISPELKLSTEKSLKVAKTGVDSKRLPELMLTTSEHIRREAIKNLGIRPEEIECISIATDPVFTSSLIKENLAEKFLQGLLITKPFVLCIPDSQNFVNSSQSLISAYSKLPEHVRATHQLAISGRFETETRDKVLHEKKQHGLSSDELVLIASPSDTDLLKLSHSAKLIACTNRRDGFAIQIFEAMAFGIPTIGFTDSCIRDIPESEEFLLDNQLTDTIAEKLSLLLTNENALEALGARCRNQTKKFTWPATATRVLNAMTRLHDLSNGSAGARYAIESSEKETDYITALTREIDREDHALIEAAKCIIYNRGISSRQLLLDVSILATSDARSGIQRVVRSILLECVDCPSIGFSVVPIRFDGDRYWSAFDAFDRLTGRPPQSRDAILDFFQDDIYISLDLLMNFGGKLRSTHRKMSARGVHMNYVVYDLLPLRNPHWWESEIASKFQGWIAEISRIADHLICISHAVADELKEYLEAYPPDREYGKPKVTSFHLGADLKTSLPSQGLPVGHEVIIEKLERITSFLMVSTVEPRKGHAQALDAFEILWKNNLDVCLVIIGKKGWKVEDLSRRIMNHKEIGHRLFWLQDASDEFLEKMYEANDCLIMASLGEGFGLPLVEAAQHKMPIIARDLPVLREIGQEHAFYFSGFSAEDLSMAIQDWLKLKRNNSHPRSDNMPWLSWKASTEQLLGTIIAGQ